jgi:hypothetical protein
MGKEIAERGHIAALYKYWQSLNGGAAPARNLLDPAAIKPLLPHIYLVEFKTDPFRVYYRLSGTATDRWNGVPLSGHYLDEFLVADKYDANRHVIQAYEQAFRSGEAVFGSYIWPTRGGYKAEIRFGLFPLTVGGIVAQAIAIEDYEPAPVSDEWISMRTAAEWR